MTEFGTWIVLSGQAFNGVLAALGLTRTLSHQKRTKESLYCDIFTVSHAVASDICCSWLQISGQMQKPMNGEVVPYV